MPVCCHGEKKGSGTVHSKTKQKSNEFENDTSVCWRKHFNFWQFQCNKNAHVIKLRPKDLCISRGNMNNCKHVYIGPYMKDRSKSTGKGALTVALQQRGCIIMTIFKTNMIQISSFIICYHFFTFLLSLRSCPQLLQTVTWINMSVAEQTKKRNKKTKQNKKSLTRSDAQNRVAHNQVCNTN